MLVFLLIRGEMPVGAEYPGALWIPHNKWGYPQGRPGRNGQQFRFIVLHSTASPGSAEEQAAAFQSSPREAGTHFVIGRDGVVVQMCSIANAAWGNGGYQPGYADYWPEEINANLLTVSIEHCKPSPDNREELTAPQWLASFRLVKWLCEEYQIPRRPADSLGGITTHASIAPIDRWFCPGPYPWADLYAYLQS